MSLNHLSVRRKGETTDFALAQLSMTQSGLPSVNEPAGSQSLQVCLTRIDVPPCPAFADLLEGTILCRTKVARVTARLPQSVQGKATEIIVPAHVQFLKCEGCDLQVSPLPDDGCEAFALAPFSLFPPGTLIPARRPLNLVAIEGSNVRGGTQGALMNITVPAWDSSGLEELVQCQQAFVYAADVRGGMVVGYLFLKAYGLCVDPVADCLRDCLTQSPAVIKSQAESVQAVSGAVHASQCACAAHSALSSSVVADPDCLLDSVLHLVFPGDALGQVTVQTPENEVPEVARLSAGVSSPLPFYYQSPFVFACTLLMRHFGRMSFQIGILSSNSLWSSGIILRHLLLQQTTMSDASARASQCAGSCCCNSDCDCVQGCVELGLRGALSIPMHPELVPPAHECCEDTGARCPCNITCRPPPSVADSALPYLPAPEFVRRSMLHAESASEESDGISDLESESGSENIGTAPAGIDGPPPDSFAAGWGYSQSHGGCWKAAVDDAIFDLPWSCITRASRPFALKGFDCQFGAAVFFLMLISPFC